MAKGLSWYKRNPADAINGMVDLTFEEQGCYNALLDHMYLEGGGLRDDAHFMARLLRTSTRTWLRLREVLIAKGKIAVQSGELINRRALAEIDDQNSWRSDLSRAGQRGGRARAKREAADREPDLFRGGIDEESTENQRGIGETDGINGNSDGKKTSGINGSGKARPSHRESDKDSEEGEESLPKTQESVTRAMVDAAAALWNQIAPVHGWPTIVALSPHRRAQLRGRMQEYGPHAWRDALMRAASSPYLAGESPPHWFRFDWAIGPKNFPKLLEGNYDELRDRDRDPTTAALAKFVGNVGSGH